MRKKITIAEKFSLHAQIILQTSELFEVYKPQSIEEFQNSIPETEILIIRSQTKITKEFLETAKKLECIVTCTSGYDHIDLVATQKKNITVMHTPDANATATAELTWALLLSSFRDLMFSQKMIKQGLWRRDLQSGLELEKKTLGLIGIGRIGQKIARFAKAFDMHIVVFDPYQEDSVFENLGLTRSSYEEVLKQADILTYHVPLTKETRNMLNRSHYELTQPHVLVMNTCRGGVVNEDDLVYALENKLISGCVLDVFEKEPLNIDSKLFKFQNALLTQHIGALTSEAFEKASLDGANAILNFYIEKKITNKLPLENNWGSLSFKD